MKITLVIPSLSAGGAERVLSNLANYWDEKGHQVTIITLAAHRPFYPLSESITLGQLDQVSAGDEGFFSRLYKIVKRVFFLRKAIQKSAADVVVSFIDIMNVTTLIACIGLKVPVVVTECTNPFFYKIPKFYQWLRCYFYQKAEKVITHTQSAEAYFNKLKNVSVVPNVVPKININRSNDKPITHIISLGRLCPNKGFADLIKAFAEIHKQNESLRLTIYSEGPDRPNLEALIQLFGLTKYVSLPGNIPEINDAFESADLFVFPSHYEGFPGALCEAMSAGLPVIASNCSGNVDVVQDKVNGRLFPVGDTETLVSLMNELISDRAQCKRLSQEAMTLSDTYSLQKIYPLWDSVIKDESIGFS